jgi:hypothetical protein
MLTHAVNVSSIGSESNDDTAFRGPLPPCSCVSLAALVLALIMAVTPVSASVVTSFAAQTDLGVVTLGANAGGLPLFGNDGGPNGGLNGSLIAPGGPDGGFPTFLAALGGGALVSSLSSAAVAPLPLFQPAQVVGGLQFGSAATGAGGGITVGPFGGSGPGGGVFWAPYTLSDGNRLGTASAIYSAGSVTLQNVSGRNFIANVPGIFVLGVSGFIPAGSFVTGSIRGTISGLTQDVEFAASGGVNDFVDDNTGIDELIEDPVAGGTLFEAFGVSVVGPFTITATGPLSFISGNATVSLLSDPMAQIEFAPLPQNLTDELDAYLANHGFILDGFSFQAGAPVPEPTTLSLVCAGLAALGGLAWRRRRSPQHTGWRGFAASRAR